MRFKYGLTLLLAFALSSFGGESADVTVTVGTIAPSKYPMSNAGSLRAQINYECGADCNGVNALSVPLGTDATFTATSSSDYRFKNWNGACSHNKPDCTFKVESTSKVIANFEPLNPAQLSVQVVSSTGSGSVSIQNSFLNCSNRPDAVCSLPLPKGKKVKLVAYDESSTTRFLGWTGTCDSTLDKGDIHECEVNLSGDKLMKANFGPGTTVYVTGSGMGLGKVTSSIPLTLGSPGNNTGQIVSWTCSNPSWNTYPPSCTNPGPVPFNPFLFKAFAKVAVGTAFTITAVPENTALFAGWTDGADQNFVPVRLVMASGSSTSFNASFAPLPNANCNLTTSVNYAGQGLLHPIATGRCIARRVDVSRPKTCVINVEKIMGNPNAVSIVGGTAVTTGNITKTTYVIHQGVGARFEELLVNFLRTNQSCKVDFKVY